MGMRCKAQLEMETQVVVPKLLNTLAMSAEPLCCLRGSASPVPLWSL